jgi:phage I-like protein
VAQTVSYLVDVSGIQFDENNCSWIQGMTLGTYEHPLFGEIKFDAARLKNFADNVSQKVLTKDPDIDYEHKMGPQGGIAAGWVKKAEVRSDGLYLLVEWTPGAVKKLQDKEYRYFSPEYVDEWQHPKTKMEHKDVLLGGALTNRPFLKDILPINLSEAFEKAGDRQVSGDNKPDPKTSDEVLKDLAKKKGVEVKDDATPEEILAAIEAKDAPPVDDKPADDKEPALLSDLTKQLSDEDKKNPVVTALLGAVQAQQAQVQQLTETVGQLATANKLAETDAQVRAFADLGDKRKLAPATQEKLRDLLVGGTDHKQFSENLLDVLKDVATGKGVVELSERGSTRTTGGAADGIKQFTDEVDKLRKEHKLSYLEATSKLAKEQPDLYTAYMEATMEVNS